MESLKVIKNYKNNHIEKNDDQQAKSTKKKDVDNDNGTIESQQDKKVDNTKYIPQSLAVIKGKKYVVIKRPSVHQNSKKKPPTDNKDNKKSKGFKTNNKDLPKSNPLPVETVNNGKFCDHFLRNVSIGFEVLFHTFQYLTIKVNIFKKHKIKRSPK